MGAQRERENASEHLFVRECQKGQEKDISFQSELPLFFPSTHSTAFPLSLFLTGSWLNVYYFLSL